MTGGGGAQSSCQEKRQQSCRNAGKSELELTNLRHNNSLENVDSSLKSVDDSSQGIDSSSQNFESYPENVGRFSRNIDNSSLNFGSFSQIFGNFSQNLKKHIHRCKLWTQFPANFAALFKVRLAATFLPFAAAFTTTLTSSLLAAVVNRRFINSLKIILLPVFFIFSSLKKVLRNCLICGTFRIFPDPLASLFGRSASRKRGRLQRPHSGAILILLALFIPIILGGIKYSEYLFERRQEALNTPMENGPIYKTCAKEAAIAVAQKWNPALTFKAQKEAAYKIADAIYNAAPAHRASALGAAIPGLSGAKQSDLPANMKLVSYPNGRRSTGSDSKYVQISIVADPTANPVDLGKIRVQTDNDVAYAVPASCNTNVVIAIPTNSTAAVEEIGKACGDFISDYFSYTRGMYFAVVPYSGKLSLPSSLTKYTATLNKYSSSGDTIKLSSLYATLSGNTKALVQNSYTWSSPYPIMHRKGGASLLFSTGEPKTDDQKFLQMNLTPCYASPQSSNCENANCTTYKANPYPIFEFSADLPSVASFCKDLTKPNDSRNASNFVFMALEWANNLFQTWTHDPKITAVGGDDTSTATTLGCASKSGKKNVVILIVNKPEAFEPGELTYLGFSNDNSGVLRQSDVIDFSNNFSSGRYADGTARAGSIEGAKKLLKFSGTSSSVTGTASRYFQMPQKHLLKFVVEQASGDSGSLRFKNINNKDDTHYKNSTTYTIKERTSFIILPEQIQGSAAPYKVEFEATNVKFITAEITDKTLGANEAKEVYCNLSGTTTGTGTATIKTNAKRPLTVKAVPKKTYVKIGGKEESGFTGTKVFEFDQTGDMSFEVKNATVSGVATIRTVTQKWKEESKEVFNKKSKGLITVDESHLLPVNTTKIEIVLFAYIHLSMKNNACFRFGSTTFAKTTEEYTTVSFGNFPEFSDGAYGNIVHDESGEYTKHICTIYYFPKTTSAQTLEVKCELTSTITSVGCYCTIWYRVPDGEVVSTSTSPSTIEGNIIKAQANQTKLTVTVTPNSLSPSVTYTKPDGSSGNNSISGEQTLTITPETYKYVEAGDEYQINLQLKDIDSISNPNMPDKLRVFKASAAPNVPSVDSGNAFLAGATLQSKTEAICRKLKDDGTRVYTIGFGTTPDKYISDCATASGGKSYTIRSLETNPQARLKEKLAEIGKDLQIVGGYGAAKVMR